MKSISSSRGANRLNLGLSRRCSFMKFRLLFACGALGFIVLTLIPATAQSTFPAKAGVRIPFRGPVPPQISSVPRVKANIPLQSRATYEDHGNVSVLHDDGTLIVPANQFDLSNQ